MGLIFSEDLSGGNAGNFDVEVVGDGISYAGGDAALTIPVTDAATYLACDSAIIDSTPAIAFQFDWKIDSLTIGSTARQVALASCFDASQQSLYMYMRDNDADSVIDTLRIQYQQSSGADTLEYDISSLVTDNTYCTITVYYQSQHVSGNNGRIYVDIDGTIVADFEGFTDQNTSRHLVDSIRFGNFNAGQSSNMVAKTTHYKNIKIAPTTAFDSDAMTYYVDPVSGDDVNTGTAAAPLKSGGLIAYTALTGETINLVATSDNTPHRHVAAENGVFDIKNSGVTVTGDGVVSTSLGVGTGQRYQWNEGASGEFYVTLTGGGDPSIGASPKKIAVGGLTDAIDDMTVVLFGSFETETTTAAAASPYNLTKTLSEVSRVTASTSGTLSIAANPPGAGEYSIVGNTIVTNAAQDGETLIIGYVASYTAGSIEVAGEYAYGDADTLGFDTVYYSPRSGETTANIRAELSQAGSGISFSVDNTIINGIIARMATVGIRDEGSSAGCYVVNASAKHCINYGLQSDGGSTKFVNCESANNQSDKQGASGLEVGGGFALTGGSTSILEGCYGHDNADDGCDIDGASTNPQVIGCRFNNNGSNSTDGCGIEMSDSAAGATICNVKTEGNNNRGISIAANVAVTLKNCVMTNEGASGALWLDTGVGGSITAEKNCFYGNSTDVGGGGAGNYSSTGDITTDPELDANDYPASTSPLVGAGVKWWTGFNPLGADGTPFSDIDTDVGAVQSKHSPLHPANL